MSDCPNCDFGISENQPHICATRQELIDELQRLYDELDGAPSTRQMKELGQYGYHVYEGRFGSWNGALKAAKLPVNTPNTECRAVGKDMILDEIRRVADELGHPPSTVEFEKENGLYHSAAAVPVKTLWGEWADALIDAGVLEASR